MKYDRRTHRMRRTHAHSSKMVAIFLVAAAVSFSTGTSWGTMAILTPLAVPLVLEAASADQAILAATVAAILGGAVFGDHCSPISDTTIL